MHQAVLTHSPDAINPHTLDPCHRTFSFLRSLQKAATVNTKRRQPCFVRPNLIRSARVLQVVAVGLGGSRLAALGMAPTQAFAKHMRHF